MCNCGDFYHVGTGARRISTCSVKQIVFVVVSLLVQQWKVTFWCNAPCSVFLIINGTSHLQRNFINIDIKLSCYSKKTSFNHATVILRQTVSINMYTCFMLSFGQFPGVWSLYTDVSEHCLFHLHRQVDVGRILLTSNCL